MGIILPKVEADTPAPFRVTIYTLCEKRLI